MGLGAQSTWSPKHQKAESQHAKTTCNCWFQVSLHPHLHAQDKVIAPQHVLTRLQVGCRTVRGRCVLAAQQQAVTVGASDIKGVIDRPGLRSYLYGKQDISALHLLQWTWRGRALSMTMAGPGRLCRCALGHQNKPSRHSTLRALIH